MNDSNQIQQQVADYYDNKIEKFGTTSKGVDWNGKESQELRFKQILKVFSSNEGSILDIGCGYGAMYSYMKESSFNSIAYVGMDISASMRKEAEKLKQQLE